MLELLRRARHRLFLANFVNMLAWLIVALTVLAAATSLAGWRRPPELPWPLILGLLAALAVAGLMAWRRTPGPLYTARRLERHFGLSERLSTSLELGARHDAVARSLREDAAARSRGLSLARFARPSLTKAQLWSLLGSGLALAVALLAPLPGRTGLIGAAVSAGAVANDSAAAAPSEFVRFVSQPVAPATPAEAVPPVIRNNARPGSPRQASDAANRTPTQPSSVNSASALSTAEAKSPQGGREEMGEAASASSSRLGEAPGLTPIESVVAPARNDGNVNPSFNQAAARDQELREYARRREAASSPGGGNGDPVAMVDAAVAGEASAGFEGGQRSALPAAPAMADELSAPSITDPSGRRVRVERLPDDLQAPAGGHYPGVVEFTAGDEPLVTREVDASAELDLLRRYRSPNPPATEP